VLRGALDRYALGLQARRRGGHGRRAGRPARRGAAGAVQKGAQRAAVAVGEGLARQEGLIGRGLFHIGEARRDLVPRAHA
jgi:hypothetical protein